jgi:DNA-binding response OmpR family regulator
MMPRLDGWGLLAQARERSPALPVIVISAVERREAAQREFLVTDHTVFLRKPFDVEALLALVERLTRSQPH